MNCRTFLLQLAGVVVAPLVVEAEQAVKMYRIGVLTPFSMEHSRRDGPSRAFFEELRNLGWHEGQNFAFDWPDSHGHPERLPLLAERQRCRRQRRSLTVSRLENA